MKTLNQWVAILLTIITVAAVSSCEDKVESTLSYEAYEPIVLTRNALNTSVVSTPAEAFLNPGRIYAYGNYIFINAPGKGIHVIDNSDKTNPRNISFIEIPGNYDMSIRNGLLYADNATDLVAIDISNILAVKTVSRVENVFSEVYPEGKRIYVNSSTEGGVIVGWKVVTVEEKVDSQNNGMFYFNGSPIETISGDFSLSNATVDMTSKAAVDQTGMAGSLSRFLIYDDFLYTLESWKIDVFDIQKTSAPQKIKEIPCTWSAETLFINNKNLFVGTRDGMIIYSLADASQPEFISQLAHFRSCDPVAVSGNYAFVTLRTNENNCGQAVGNELEVISIENLKEPKVVAVYPMTAPRGVGIDGSTLFVCDGEAGLKIFNAADVLNIDKNQLIQYTDINATDVIPMGKYLLTLGTEGLSQYDYSDPKNIKRISSLTLK